MVRTLPSTARGCAFFVLVFLNTGGWCVVLLSLALVRILTPVPRWRRRLETEMVRCGERWVGANGGIMRVLLPTRWVVTGVEDLDYDGSHLLISNHQSWSDILAVLKAFHRRIPFARFFIKQQILWVPLLGAALWALDFPFMKRYSRRHLQQHPELKGIDVETTRKACEHYREKATTIINYVEGTRFTRKKHARQDSPYRHLLKPKAGGVALVVEIMGDMLAGVLDVTIVYKGASTHFWDFACGRVEEIVVEVRRLELPGDLTGGDYQGDEAFRGRFQTWIRQIWREKDQRIAQLLAAEPVVKEPIIKKPVIEDRQ